MSNDEQAPAFVLKKIKEVTIEDRPTPKLKTPYDVKIHVKATG
jgi:threonine dehydrogenase-like Zn-dependent dehydrogenase